MIILLDSWGSLCFTFSLTSISRGVRLVMTSCREEGPNEVTQVGSGCPAAGGRGDHAVCRRRSGTRQGPGHRDLHGPRGRPAQGVRGQLQRRQPGHQPGSGGDELGKVDGRRPGRHGGRHDAGQRLRDCLLRSSQPAVRYDRHDEGQQGLRHGRHRSAGQPPLPVRPPGVRQGVLVRPDQGLQQHRGHHL